MSQKRALITGITGQDGSYLAEYLLERGYQVFGLVRRSSVNNKQRLDHIDDRNLEYVCGDLLDPLSLVRALEYSVPEIVFNLADQDHVGFSQATPSYSYSVTFAGAGNMMEAVAEYDRKIRFFQPLSATFFRPSDKPLTLESECAPRTPYACCKYALRSLANYYRWERQLEVYCGIMFNHDSPRRTGDYLLQKIVDRSKQIAEGKRDDLNLYDVDMQVDIGYAKEFMTMVANVCTSEFPPVEFLVGTGQPFSIRDLAKNALIRFGVNPEFVMEMRQPIVAELRECLICEQLSSHWKPAHNAMTTLNVIIDARKDT